MKRVTGIGGIFIKSADPQKMRDWYKKHLGIESRPWGGSAFRWAGPHNPDGHGTTVWNIFEASSGYFAPSQAQFMVNYRVDKSAPPARGIARRRAARSKENLEASEYGKFGWVVDPDGNKIELWEPPEGQ